jgi:ATP-dependent RNA helicase RhlE
MNDAGIKAAAIHGNKVKAKNKSARRFKKRKSQLLLQLICTWIRHSLLPHVVNFELPNIPRDYVHRIGKNWSCWCKWKKQFHCLVLMRLFFKRYREISWVNNPKENIKGFNRSNASKNL